MYCKGYHVTAITKFYFNPQFILITATGFNFLAVAKSPGFNLLSRQPLITKGRLQNCYIVRSELMILHLMLDGMLKLSRMR